MQCFKSPSYKDIVAIHDDQLALYGGAAGIINDGLIHSAIGRVENGYYENLTEAACALMESLAISHCFLDGNKRVAYFSAVAFLDAYGYYIDFDDVEAGKYILKLFEEGQFNKKTLYQWLSPLVKQAEE